MKSHRFEDIKAADPDVGTPEYQAAYAQARRDLMLGMQVRAVREAAGLTQAQLAEMVGTRQPNIARIEAGAGVPRIDTLDRIAAALGIELDVSFRPPPKRRRLGEIASEALAPFHAAFVGGARPALQPVRAAKAAKVPARGTAKAAQANAAKKAAPRAAAKKAAPAKTTAKATGKAVPSKAAAPPKAAKKPAAPKTGNAAARAEGRR